MNAILASMNMDRRLLQDLKKRQKRDLDVDGSRVMVNRSIVAMTKIVIVEMLEG